MPFIGNQPALSYTSFAKQDFTTSATTSYALSQPVTNENEIALFINFVRQEPTTAYTASGTSLTLTSATSASDDMYAIFLGKAVQTVNPPAGSVNSSSLASGNLTIPNGNIVFDTSSKGIYLGVTSATASNLLDDYEEGTWTPSFVVTVSGTVTSLTGTYTKVGRIVTISMTVTGTSLNLPTYARVTGMPFAVSSVSTGTYVFSGIEPRTHGWTLLAGISEWYLSSSGTASATEIYASTTYQTT
jgi:hypothetical protein